MSPGEASASLSQLSSCTDQLRLKIDTVICGLTAALGILSPSAACSIRICPFGIASEAVITVAVDGHLV